MKTKRSIIILSAIALVVLVATGLFIGANQLTKQDRREAMISRINEINAQIDALYNEIIGDEITQEERDKKYDEMCALHKKVSEEIEKADKAGFFDGLPEATPEQIADKNQILKKLSETIEDFKYYKMFLEEYPADSYVANDLKVLTKNLDKLLDFEQRLKNADSRNLSALVEEYNGVIKNMEGLADKD